MNLLHSIVETIAANEQLNWAVQTPLTVSFLATCSHEHGWGSSPKTLANTYPFTATQASPATRTELMAETPLKPLRTILETIRKQADYALKQLGMRESSGKCDGNAKPATTRKISPGRFLWKRRAGAPDAEAFRSRLSPKRIGMGSVLLISMRREIAD